MTHETAHLTADVAVFANDQAGQTCVLLIKRGNTPYVGCWALPGGHVDRGEHPRTAALRELAEETGLALTDCGLETAGVAADANRDPRGRYIAFVYCADVGSTARVPAPVAQDDAADVAWVPLDDLNEHELAFDHLALIEGAQIALARAKRFLASEEF